MVTVARGINRTLTNGVRSPVELVIAVVRSGIPAPALQGDEIAVVTAPAVAAAASAAAAAVAAATAAACLLKQRRQVLEVEVG